MPGSGTHCGSSGKLLSIPHEICISLSSFYFSISPLLPNILDSVLTVSLEDHLLVLVGSLSLLPPKSLLPPLPLERGRWEGLVQAWVGVRVMWGGHVRRGVRNKHLGRVRSSRGALEKYKREMVACGSKGVVGPHVAMGLEDPHDFLEPSEFHGSAGELGKSGRGG